MDLPPRVIVICKPRISSPTSCPPSAFSFNTLSPYSCPMVTSCLMGLGWFGTDISEVDFSSMLCTTRSPNGHFAFNSTAPAGGVKVEAVFNLPDLLQPTQKRLDARVTVIRNMFLFMDLF